MGQYIDSTNKPHIDSLDPQQWCHCSVIGKEWFCTTHGIRSIDSPYGKNCIMSPNSYHTQKSILAVLYSLICER